MPLTLFTVSDLLYQYLRLTDEKQAKEREGDDDNDDASSIESSVENNCAEKDELVRERVWLFAGVNLFHNNVIF